MDYKTFALMLLQRQPQIANSPMGQQFIKILQTGNVQAGQQMAQNICQAYGVTLDQALGMAKQQFNV